MCGNPDLFLTEPLLQPLLLLAEEGEVLGRVRHICKVPDEAILGGTSLAVEPTNHLAFRGNRAEPLLQVSLRALEELLGNCGAVVEMQRHENLVPAKALH